MPMARSSSQQAPAAKIAPEPTEGNAPKVLMWTESRDSNTTWVISLGAKKQRAASSSNHGLAEKLAQAAQEALSLDPQLTLAQLKDVLKKARQLPKAPQRAGSCQDVSHMRGVRKCVAFLGACVITTACPTRGLDAPGRLGPGLTVLPTLAFSCQDPGAAPQPPLVEPELPNKFWA